LLQQLPKQAQARGVGVGYDGRVLGRELAEDTASVLTALGIPAHVTPRRCWCSP
jgi:phosphomannomutase